MSMWIAAQNIRNFNLAEFISKGETQEEETEMPLFDINLIRETINT